MLSKYKDLIKSSDSDSVSSQTSTNLESKSALIGSDVKIKGDVISEEDIVIAGEVTGIVQAKSHHIHISDTGILNADITGNIVSIEGSVKGNIVGLENVIITSTGNVLGNIECPRLSLEDGAKFKGSIEMNPGEPAQSVLPIFSVSNAKVHRSVKESGQTATKAS